ncbi:hypothetical protein MKZ38_008753 [Zalerion maritima]|uniref:Protein kinase domain-containing protein n=1 Tax=Zalerion maritima TaxID=339359 RepID=A0AAD5RGW6_9PEZI|nr:hypothetical protein MKZ38_008753 [Zalerion maritima]
MTALEQIGVALGSVSLLLESKLIQGVVEVASSRETAKLDEDFFTTRRHLVNALKHDIDNRTSILWSTQAKGHLSTEERHDIEQLEADMGQTLDAAKSRIYALEKAIEERRKAPSAPTSLTGWMVRAFSGRQNEYDRRRHELEVAISDVLVAATSVISLHACRGQVVQNELMRISLNKIGTLLTEVAKGGVSPTQLAVLDSRTEGMQEMMEQVSRATTQLFHASDNIERRLDAIAPSNIGQGWTWTREQLDKQVPNLEIPGYAITCNKDVDKAGCFRVPAVRKMKDSNGVEKQDEGFVEWRIWDDNGKTAPKSEEVREQVVYLTKILSRSLAGTAGRTPKCDAFFLEEGAYGLFLSIPGVHKETVGHGQPIPTPPPPRSLHELVGGDGIPEPPLGWKIRSAVSLLNAVFFLHSWEVFHKAISSSNVLYFPPDAKSKSPPKGGPYLAGFSHARLAAAASDHAKRNPATEDAFLPWEYLEKRKGQPVYTKKDSYRRKYDLFGLGMTLAELLAWDHVANITLVRGKDGAHAGNSKWEEPNARELLHQRWDGDGGEKENLVSTCLLSLEGRVCEVFGRCLEWCFSTGASSSGEESRTYLADLNRFIGELEELVW